MDPEKTGIVVVEGVPVESDVIRQEIKDKMKEEIREEILKEIREEAVREAKNGMHVKAGEISQNRIQSEVQVDRGTRGEESALQSACAFLCAFVVLATPVALLVWFIFDLSAAFDPEYFFDPVPDCKVLNVTKEFVNKSMGCADRFRYEFTPNQFESVVRVFTQEEEFTRADSGLCTNPDAVGLEAARFAVGTQKQCLLLRQFFEFYIPSFNCATPSPPCYIILPLISSHDPTAAVVVFATPFALVFLLWVASYIPEK